MRWCLRLRLSIMVMARPSIARSPESTPPTRSSTLGWARASVADDGDGTGAAPGCSVTALDGSRAVVMTSHARASRSPHPDPLPHAGEGGPSRDGGDASYPLLLAGEGGERKRAGWGA